MNLPYSNNKFDVILCTQVLHHLENPSNGLNCLKNVLKEDGGMFIMVYGKIGRTGIYQMQDLLKLVNANINNYPDKIQSFKTIYFIINEKLYRSHTCIPACPAATKAVLSFNTTSRANPSVCIIPSTEIDQRSSVFGSMHPPK